MASATAVGTKNDLDIVLFTPLLRHNKDARTMNWNGGDAQLRKLLRQKQTFGGSLNDRGETGRNSFLKKRTKKLLLIEDRVTK
jgi:hypothetical protein